jgi:RNA polymerase sigma-B factor
MTITRSRASKPDTGAALVEYARTRDPELRADILETYSGLADAMAARFSTSSDSIEDLRQEAAIGLINALDRFDPDRRVAFTSYAWATISGQLKRYLRDRCWRVRVSRELQETCLRARAEVDELRLELGREPTNPELARRCNVDPDELDRALHASSAQRPSSLDGTAGGHSIHDVLGMSDPSFDLVIDRRIVVQLLAHLPEREQQVVSLHYLAGVNQTELGMRLGISQAHVSRLLQRSLQLLRDVASGKSGPVEIGICP